MGNLVQKISEGNENKDKETEQAPQQAPIPDIANGHTLDGLGNFTRILFNDNIELAKHLCTSLKKMKMFGELHDLYISDAYECLVHVDHSDLGDFISFINVITFIVVVYILENVSDQTPSDYIFFDEVIFPLHIKKGKEAFKLLENHRDKLNKSKLIDVYLSVHGFMNIMLSPLYQKSHFAILFLYSLDHVKHRTNFVINFATWRKICLGLIVLTNKMSDDRAIFNRDLVHMWKNVSTYDINHLDEFTLKLIDYNLIMDEKTYLFYLNNLKVFALKVGFIKPIIFSSDSLIEDEHDSATRGGYQLLKKKSKFFRIPNRLK